MKRVPNFYRRNAAQGVARRVVAGKKASPEQMRDTVGQVVTWCYLIALRGVTKWDVHGMDDFLEKAARNAEDYMIRVRAGSSDRPGASSGLRSAWASRHSLRATWIRSKTMRFSRPSMAS